MRRVLVCGGRDFDDRDTISRVLSKHVTLDDILISGNADGADSIAASWARQHGIDLCVCPPNWAEHGLNAGPVRNAAMIKLQPDLVIAFPGDKGTQDMLRKARGAKISFLIVRAGETHDELD